MSLLLISFHSPVFLTLLILNYCVYELPSGMNHQTWQAGKSPNKPWRFSSLGKACINTWPMIDQWQFSWWVDILSQWGLPPSIHFGNLRFHSFTITNQRMEWPLGLHLLKSTPKGECVSNSFWKPKVMLETFIITVSFRLLLLIFWIIITDFLIYYYYWFVYFFGRARGLFTQIDPLWFNPH